MGSTAKGQPGGVATLDSAGVLASAQRPLAGVSDYPGTVGDFNQVGSSATEARSDHSHQGVPPNRQVIAGTGLTGGGDLSADRTLAVSLSDLGIPDAAGLLAPAVRLPRVPQASSVVTTFQSGHGWTSSGTGATFSLNDTADFISGSQAAKMTTGGAGAQTNIRKFAGSVADTTGKMFRLRIKVDDITHLNELDFYLGSSSLGNNYKWQFFVGGASTWITSGDWCTVTLSFADATTTGSPARSGMTDLQLQAWDDNTGNPVVVHIQSVELIPDGSGTFASGVASICFDDCWLSPLSLGSFNKLDSLSWPASLFVITDVLGVAGRLTLADLKTRRDRYGWEIAGHAYTDAAHGLSYTGETAAALDADRRAQRAWLLANGFRDGDGSAYPLGQFGRTTDNAATTDYSRRYFSYERTTAGRSGTETWPPADPLRLRARSGISTAAGGITPTSLTTSTTGVIDKAAGNAAWLILVFHKIVTGTPATTAECKDTDFNAIIDKINSAGMAVRSVGDVLRHYTA